MPSAVPSPDRPAPLALGCPEKRRGKLAAHRALNPLHILSLTVREVRVLIAVQGCPNKPVRDGCLGLCRELNAGDILAARVAEFSALAVIPMVVPTL